jgi:hypothetical protein
LRAGLFLRIVPLAVIAAGCQQHRPGSELRGGSSFEILDPATPVSPVPGQKAEQSDIEVKSVAGFFTQRKPAEPVYPAGALAAGAGLRVVTVTVSFDDAGRVTDVTPSLRGFSVQDRFSDDFLAAVEDAVRQWRVQPPYLVFYRIGAGGERTYLRAEAQPASMDVRFTFEASGKVR